MKTIKHIGLLAFTALTLVMYSCSSDDGSGETGSNMATYISATVDGTAFTTFEQNGFLSAIAHKEVDDNGTEIQIYGVAIDESGMTIMLKNVTATGTYPIDGITGNGVGYSNAQGVVISSLANCDGVTGELKVTSISATKIEGTFSFVGKSNDCATQRTVTNGKFKGTFTEN